MKTKIGNSIRMVKFAAILPFLAAVALAGCVYGEPCEYGQPADTGTAAWIGVPSGAIIRNPEHRDNAITEESFILAAGIGTADDGACPFCVVWDYPREAAMPEEYLNRYFFPELGFSFAVPKAWEGMYGITGLRTSPPLHAGDAAATLYNPAAGLVYVVPSFPRLEEFAFSFHRIPIIREQLRALPGRCADDAFPDMRILLARDEEYLYFMRIGHEFLRTDDAQSADAETFYDIINMHPFVLNSFKLIVQ